MRIVILLFAFILSYADVSEIIATIKNIERYKPKFKTMENYNPFVKTIVKNTEQNIVNNVSVVKEKAFKLYAVFQNKVNINGKWLKVGDIIEGYKIIKVTSNGVSLLKDGKIKTISLKASFIKVGK